MADHVRILAILQFGYAALAVIGGTLVAFLAEGPGWMRLVAAFLTVLAGVALLAGIGLIRRRRWGRFFAFATAAARLLSVPVGTAFGVYVFVALRKPEVVATLG